MKDGFYLAFPRFPRISKNRLNTSLLRYEQPGHGQSWRNIRRTYLYRAAIQKRLKHLQIIINGLIPRDAINTRQRQKLLEVNQLLRDKCTSYNSVYFLKPDKDWTTLDGGLNKTFYYKDNIHLLEKGNNKLALSIKTKLDHIRINCHEIAINEKVVPTIKVVDYQRAELCQEIDNQTLPSKEISNCSHQNA